MLKNFNPSASSIKPRKTFTELSQPPDLGRLLSHWGNNAKRVNGKAKASEKPNIPTIGFRIMPPADSTRIAPTIGPVQLKETSTSVSAIKKAPPAPPLLTLSSLLLIQLEGKIISKAPKNEKAKTTKIMKNRTFGSQWVLSQLAKSAPRVMATMVPIRV